MGRPRFLGRLGFKDTSSEQIKGDGGVIDGEESKRWGILPDIRKARESCNCQSLEQNDERGRPRSPPGVPPPSIFGAAIDGRVQRSVVEGYDCSLVASEVDQKRKKSVAMSFAREASTV